MDNLILSLISKAYPFATPLGFSCDLQELETLAKRSKCLGNMYPVVLNVVLNDVPFAVEKMKMMFPAPSPFLKSPSEFHL